MPAVGARVPRKEGIDKLCGLTRYIDDVTFSDCLHGVTLRSAIPRGRVKKIDFDPDFPWHECVIVSARDIPGKNHVALIENDQPLLVDGLIRHPMEPILLLAHPSREKAYEALKHIRVECEALAPVLSIEESLALKQVIYAPDNVFKSFLIQKGDVNKGFAEADVVVEGEYRVGHQEQAYIENNGMAAYMDNGVVTVIGSMQCPYYVHKALKQIFNKNDAGVRVIQSPTGGGFGGKEEYPSLIAGHAALLALKSGKPVKLIYDRAEDMAATTKRHPAVIRHKTGLTRDGRLIAQDIDVVMDGGAYVTLSPVVLSRGALHATGPYECPHVRVRARVVATNTPPNGAFRGFGAPQTLFAAELHWEKIADALGRDAAKLRRLNAFKEGSVTATGQVLRESVGAREVLERCLRMSRYEAKRKSYAAFNRREKNKVWKGIGLALCHHGAGFTGSGEVYLASQAGISLTPDGRVLVLAASTEIGQGTNTVFAQIAADALGAPYALVDVEVVDTARVPNSGPTVASRTCMIVGGLVERAARLMKKELDDVGIAPRSRAALKRAARRLCSGGKEKRFIVEYEKPPEILWDDKEYRGDAYGVYSYAAAAADVEVDKGTFEVRVKKIYTAQDIGKAVHPLLAEGQIIGGSVQAVGYALYENAVYRDGVMQNGQLTNYVIPTALDSPPMEVAVVEKPYSRGPFGAKGVGELPMDVPGPAIAAAVYRAAGSWVPELPLSPEKIQKAFDDRVNGQR